MLKLQTARSFLLLATLFLIAAAGAAPAQAGVAPPGPPICTGYSQQVSVQVWSAGQGVLGKNYLSVPLQGPVQSTPNDQTQNGFHVLCAMMGIDGISDIDGDGVIDNAEIIQYDPMVGTVNTFLCSQPISSSPWLPNQGMEIHAFLSNSASITLNWDWPECTQAYAAYGWGYGQGVQIAPSPVPWWGTLEPDICDQYNLMVSLNSKVQRIDAQNGLVFDFYCGAPLSPYPPLFPGEGVRFEPYLAPWAGPGDPVNCAVPTGSGCPATPCPCHNYPCPMTGPGTAPWYCPY